MLELIRFMCWDDMVITGVVRLRQVIDDWSRMVWVAVISDPLNKQSLSEWA